MAKPLKPRDSTVRRGMVGNDIQGGGRAYTPPAYRRHKAVHIDMSLLQERREQVIRMAAEPPKVVPATVPQSNLFNQIAYSILLIAILGGVAAGTSYVNWAFLIYGCIAVIARFPSANQFICALLAMVVIPVSTAVHRDTLASDFAVLTFYFLLIGLILSVIELRREERKAKKAKKKRLRSTPKRA